MPKLMSGWAVQPGGRRGPHTAGNRWPATGVETRAGTRFGTPRESRPTTLEEAKSKAVAADPDASGRYGWRAGRPRSRNRQASTGRHTERSEHAGRSLGRQKPRTGEVEQTARGLTRNLPPTDLAGAKLRRTKSHERCRAPAKESGQAVPNAHHARARYAELKTKAGE